MKKRLVSLLLCVTMTVFMLAGCGNSNNEVSNDPVSTQAAKETKAPDAEVPATEVPKEEPTEAPTQLTYSGDLTIMHFSTSEESEGNGGSDGFRTMLAQWKEEHSGINLVENVLANAEYKVQIATLAGVNDLPDVFLLQGMNTKDWANQGIILDMTDIISSSPYAANYKEEFFTPFKDGDGKIYGLPALTGGTCTVVIYDKAMWKEAGFDTFPTTWDEVLKAKEYFAGEKVDTIAFGNGGKWQANSCFMSTIGDLFTGPQWFQSIIDKGGAAFTDQAFVDALTFTQEAFQSGVFNKDFNAVTNEDAREYFIAGDSAAFIGGNWDVSYIMSVIKESDPDRYNEIGFATFPTPSNATGNTNVQNIGMGYAVAINAKVAEDPDKLAAAVDLAYKLTGPDFANFVASNYALGGLTEVEDVDLSKFDEVTQAFYNYSYVDTNTCEIYDSYINGEVWDVFNTKLQGMLNGDTTPSDVAQKTEEAYQKDYAKQ